MECAHLLAHPVVSWLLKQIPKLLRWWQLVVNNSSCRNDILGMKLTSNMNIAASVRAATSLSSLHQKKTFLYWQVFLDNFSHSGTSPAAHTEPYTVLTLLSVPVTVLSLSITLSIYLFNNNHHHHNNNNRLVLLYVVWVYVMDLELSLFCLCYCYVVVVCQMRLQRS